MVQIALRLGLEQLIEYVAKPCRNPSVSGSRSEVFEARPEKNRALARSGMLNYWP